jgi:thioredoxin-related protein
MTIRKSPAATARFILILGMIIMGPAITRGADGIQWETYQQGIAKSKSDQKKVFLNFYADWCRYCKVMEKETFQNSAVIAYINRNFIPIKVNSDKEQQTAALYNVSGLPSTWFLSEKGERIGNRPGLITATEMLSILKYIQSDSYQKMTFGDFVKQHAH